MHDAPNFAVPGMLTEGRHSAIRLYEPLQFTRGIPWSTPPLQIEAQRGRGQIAGSGFSRQVIDVLTMQVRSTIGGCSDSKSLENRVPQAAAPIDILVLIQQTPPIRRR